jgi:hypothetical protein
MCGLSLQGTAFFSPFGLLGPEDEESNPSPVILQDSSISINRAMKTSKLHPKVDHNLNFHLFLWGPII